MLYIPMNYTVHPLLSQVIGSTLAHLENIWEQILNCKAISHIIQKKKVLLLLRGWWVSQKELQKKRDMRELHSLQLITTSSSHKIQHLTSLFYLLSYTNDRSAYNLKLNSWKVNVWLSYLMKKQMRVCKKVSYRYIATFLTLSLMSRSRNEVKFVLLTISKPERSFISHVIFFWLKLIWYFHIPCFKYTLISQTFHIECHIY